MTRTLRRVWPTLHPSKIYQSRRNSESSIPVVLWSKAGDNYPYHRTRIYSRRIEWPCSCDIPTTFKREDNCYAFFGLRRALLGRKAFDLVWPPLVRKIVSHRFLHRNTDDIHISSVQKNFQRPACINESRSET